LRPGVGEVGRDGGWGVEAAGAVRPALLKCQALLTLRPRSERASVVVPHRRKYWIGDGIPFEMAK
jgi:hypothetical protein